MPTNKLGNTIKNLRVTRGLTMLELATAVGIDKSYVSYLESGTKTNVSLDILKKIAQVLQIPLPQLLA
jgi:XRE family transcriptional regulator of biofilm formation